MMQLLSENPLLLLFLVASIGYLVGSIKIKGSSLGVAAVLFIGLVFGALDERLEIPNIIFLLGLSIFVYSIGLSSGPAFFKSYKKNGIRDFIFTISMLLLSGLIAAVLSILLDFSAATTTGIYAGSTTNTAALAGVIDYINATYQGASASKQLEDMVVGFSFSYPMGVMGGIIAILLMEKLLKIDYKKEQELLRKEYPVGSSLSSVPVEINQEAVVGIPMRDLFKKHDWDIQIGRVYSNGYQFLANWDSIFNIGDIVMLVGNEQDLEEVIPTLGNKVKSSITYDRQQFDVRRIFVSNENLAGRSLASLNIHEKYNAAITRIRRGDVDMLAKGDTVLEIGDRIRFIANRKDLRALSAFFGDSYQQASKVNLFSFGLGIGLGLMLGNVEISLAPDFSFKLGYAGGPLIVGLILGAVRRTGPIVWALPYSANVTLQQIGLIFLLSAIGVRSGQAFVQSISLEGINIFLAGTTISLITAFSILFVGYKIVKMPFSLLMGMVANQPAILYFAMSRSNNNIPAYGYAMIFPIALICKILIAQVLFILLS